MLEAIMQPFDRAWEEIIDFAESESSVRTITRGNRNRIGVVSDGIEVENVNTQNRRTISKDDLRYAYRLLGENGQLTLADIEPELAGRKSMTLAIL